MNWDNCTNQWQGGKSYLSSQGGYRLTTQVVGFGIEVCDILKFGTFIHRTVGHNALNLAKAWCEDDARIPEVDLPRLMESGR